MLRTRAAQAPPPIIHPTPAPKFVSSALLGGVWWCGGGGGLAPPFVLPGGWCRLRRPSSFQAGGVVCAVLVLWQVRWFGLLCASGAGKPSPPDVRAKGRRDAGGCGEEGRSLVRVRGATMRMWYSHHPGRAQGSPHPPTSSRVPTPPVELLRCAMDDNMLQLRRKHSIEILR